MLKVAILQSNYIPWKGYFDIIDRVDLFIFHDDLRFTKNDWRNRNKIKTENGLKWLTIPCGTDQHRNICEVEIKEHGWQVKHWNLISDSYRKAPYFDMYKEFFIHLYLDTQWKNLSELNKHVIMCISNNYLGSTTQFADSQDYHLKECKAARVVELLQKAGATHYLSGPAAKAYLSEKDLAPHGIQLDWIDYSSYPEYYQFFPPFCHEVSILDLLFHKGPHARMFMSMGEGYL